MRSFLVIHGIAFFLYSCGPVQHPSLNIAVASNARYAMEEIGNAYENKTGKVVNLTISSSGKLTAQILEGAPYDLFFSADLAYPTTLYERGLSDKPPSVYATGKLVLWTLQDHTTLNLEMLQEDKINRIALPNPATAPYGKAAMEALHNAQVKTKLKDKLIFGESLGQASQFVFSKAADVGFSSLSQVLSPQLSDKATWAEVKTSLYHPIEQGVVLISTGDTDNTEALRFLDFMKSEDAICILKDFGFEVYE